MVAIMTEPTDTRTITQLRIEPELWERAKRLARNRRMSTNAYACAAIEAYVRADEAGAALPSGGPILRKGDGE